MRSLIALFAVLLLATPALAEDEGGASEQATDFTLRSIEGGNVSLSDFLGEKVILVNFWATWCAPCMKELPKLNELQQKLGPQGLQIISITVDEAKDEAKVKSIVRRFSYEPVVLLDQETRVVDIYNKRKDMPYTLIIGRDGLIHHKKKGFTEGDEKHLEEWITELLK